MMHTGVSATTKRLSAEQQGAMLLALALASGAALGWLSWGPGRAPALAALLPVLIAQCKTRGQAFALGAGYTLGILRHTAAFIGSWFDDSLLIGGAAVATYALISGSVWCLGWSSSSSEWRKALAVAVAWAVALLPPATLGLPGHPLIAWGTIAPGSGWFGVAASVLVPAVLVWVMQRCRARIARSETIALMVLLAGLGALGLARYEPASSHAPGIAAVSTEWGKTGGADDVLRRTYSMGQMSERLAVEGAPLTVFWPESILGEYDPALYPILEMDVLQPAEKHGQTMVIGIDLPLPGRKFENAAVAFYPDGRSAVAVARQPAPVSLWKPWRRDWTFLADWTASNMLSLRDERRAAIIFCYEEYLPILYLINEARDRPDIYLAMANTWAERSPIGSEIQTQHSLGIARLFGRLYVKAENRPIQSRAGQHHLP